VSKSRPDERTAKLARSKSVAEVDTDLSRHAKLLEGLADDPSAVIVHDGSYRPKLVTAGIGKAAYRGGA